jgi:hypothetical protein
VHSKRRRKLRIDKNANVVGHDKKRANTFFMIVQRKVLKVAEVFATTVKRWSQGKNRNQKVALLIWRLA